MKGGDGSFSYFSGSVVVDRANCAGFGHEAFIAFYTMHIPGDSLPETQGNLGKPRQGNDHGFLRGQSCTGHRPDILPRPAGVLVRTPRTVEDGGLAPRRELIYIYESDNLLEWTYCSVFGGLGAIGEFGSVPTFSRYRSMAAISPNG